MLWLSTCLNDPTKRSLFSVAFIYVDQTSSLRCPSRQDKSGELTIKEFRIAATCHGVLFALLLAGKKKTFEDQDDWYWYTLFIWNTFGCPQNLQKHVFSEQDEVPEPDCFQVSIFGFTGDEITLFRLERSATADHMSKARVEHIGPWFSLTPG